MGLLPRTLITNTWNFKFKQMKTIKMKITRRKLRRLIKEAIDPNSIPKIMMLINSDNQEDQNMAAALIETYYEDLYQLSIIEGDFISVAVKAPKETGSMNEDLNDLMTKFNLEFDEFMPPTTLETETANVKDEYKLQSPDHCRVHFKYDEEADYDDGSYDEESSGDGDYYDEDLGDYY